MQVKSYFFFNVIQFNTDTEKVIWAITYLRDKAERQVQPYLTNTLENITTNRRINLDTKLYTRKIFSDQEYFKEAIQQVFSNTNKEKVAILAI